MEEQRYTLSLPPEIYKELREQAKSHNMSIKEVVRQCLKIGLLTIKVSENPRAELFVREELPQADNTENVVKETRLQIVW
jgi:5,10-methylene-tetrahydrofolate dehydrogenase/methenyl tetrahydrofolate cyclohydrolase